MDSVIDRYTTASDGPELAMCFEQKSAKCAYLKRGATCANKSCKVSIGSLSVFPWTAFHFAICIATAKRPATQSQCREQAQNQSLGGIHLLIGPLAQITSRVAFADFSLDG